MAAEPWIMEILIEGEWKPIHQANQPPYRYATARDARDMIMICYPGLEHYGTRRIKNTETDEIRSVN